MGGTEDSGDCTPNRLVLAQLSKTKMCIKFSRGTCKESDCCFAHSAMELRQAPNLAKTAICRAFLRGKCSDAECNFAHGEDELRVGANVYKTQLCNFHARGHCKKGDRCRHAHGRKELREMEEQAPPSPAGTDSPKREPQVSAPPGLSRSTLVDISNERYRSPEQSNNKYYDTPEKSNRRKAAPQNCSSNYGTSPAAKPMKVLMSESGPVATPPVAQLWLDESSPMLGSQLSSIPPLPTQWPLQPWSQTTPGDMAFTNNLAAAAAAVAAEHSAAASAASAAAFAWACAAAQQEGGATDIASVMLLMQNMFQAPDQPIPSAGLQQVTSAVDCKQAGVDRKWVL